MHRTLILIFVFSTVTFAGPYETGPGAGKPMLKKSEDMGTGESKLSLDSFGTLDDSDLVDYVQDDGYIPCKWSGSILEVYRTRSGKVGAKKGVNPKVSGKTTSTDNQGTARLVLGPNFLIQAPTENYLITARGGKCVVNGKTIEADFSTVVATKYLPYKSFYRLNVKAFVNKDNPNSDVVYSIEEN